MNVSNRNDVMISNGDAYICCIVISQFYNIVICGEVNEYQMNLKYYRLLWLDFERLQAHRTVN